MPVLDSAVFAREIKERGKKPTFHWIYIHTDGDMLDVGKTLLTYYGQKRKMNELFKLGNLYYLGNQIGFKHSIKDRIGRLNLFYDDCLAYNRDLKVKSENKSFDGTDKEFVEYVQNQFKGKVNWFYIYNEAKGWRYTNKNYSTFRNFDMNVINEQKFDDEDTDKKPKFITWGKILEQFEDISNDENETENDFDENVKQKEVKPRKTVSKAASKPLNKPSSKTKTKAATKEKPKPTKPKAEPKTKPAKPSKSKVKSNSAKLF